MRAGLSDTDFVKHNDEIIAVNLGWDFCSEHEWGIKEIKSSFGINDELTKKNVGFITRKVTILPKELELLSTEEEMILGFSDYNYSKIDFKEYKRRILRDQQYSAEEKNLVCAWSGRDFGILVKDNVGKNFLRQLYNSFKEKDVVIFFASNQNPFSNSGLTIAIYSKIPKGSLEQAKESDLDALALMKASDKTMIIKKLDKANSKESSWPKKCGYYACSPRWINDSKKKESKHPVMYWLNPQDQQANKAGWYTVEDLEQWIKDKGPIIKKEEK